MLNQRYVDLLRKSNYKITPQRLRVIDYVSSHPGHFRAEDVFFHVKGVEPSITLATIYNIFRAMIRSGIINSFEINGTTWFESNTNPHANLFCEVCHKFEDVELPDQFFTKKLSKELGIQVNSASVLLKGTCSVCNARAN
ncbi:MAG: transcriptional repressor [Candidatus Thermoplasmatota archaeon]|jgi:Fe2+ or Zn2+ uptake regulation protein|nr:transcriptional repressor [Candidatus Thermoplasmatota archaeon]MCL5785196.1 transcriptional repressor [Candidatus Thermoplasmatota archaeon]